MKGIIQLEIETKGQAMVVTIAKQPDLQGNVLSRG